jgi:hypothetical protein
MGNVCIWTQFLELLNKNTYQPQYTIISIWKGNVREMLNFATALQHQHKLAIKIRPSHFTDAVIPSEWRPLPYWSTNRTSIFLTSYEILLWSVRLLTTWHQDRAIPLSWLLHIKGGTGKQLQVLSNHTLLIQVSSVAALANSFYLLSLGCVSKQFYKTTEELLVRYSSRMTMFFGNNWTLSSWISGWIDQNRFLASPFTDHCPLISSLGE